jgi:decaprenylphospho-beta-D-ribofuranose 2-oxidase
MSPIESCGWGRVPTGKMDFIQVSRAQNISQNLRGYIPVGMKRSYGDSTLNSGGVGISTSNFNGVYIDTEKGIAHCGSGVLISDLELRALQVGFYPYVVPGTGMVSLGGAVASDIHGKSHNRVGSFARYVRRIVLQNENGIERSLYPDGSTSDLFWATVGGMGLTGLILEIELQLMPVKSDLIATKHRRVNNLHEMLTEVKKFESEFLYTVAWVDLSGDFRGRGIVSGGNHFTGENLKENRARSLKVSRKTRYKLPDILPNWIISAKSIRLFNFFWFHKPIGGELEDILKFMHPLDMITNWNVIYGKKGLIQYQFVVPYESESFLHEVLLDLKTIRASSFLTVLKSFGEKSPGLLSFPRPGWTLAIDFPADTPGLSVILDKLDSVLVQNGGAVYLTKDSRLSSAHFEKMYKDATQFRAIKSQIDPHGFWKSDQGRRLKLC